MSPCDRCDTMGLGKLGNLLEVTQLSGPEPANRTREVVASRSRVLKVFARTEEE